MYFLIYGYTLPQRTRGARRKGSRAAQAAAALVLAAAKAAPTVRIAVAPALETVRIFGEHSGIVVLDWGIKKTKTVL